MRPPEFTGGNVVLSLLQVKLKLASMRPPEFTGGNDAAAPARHREATICFNEAAGIHRRKRICVRERRMRKSCFNEAAGIHRRKPGLTMRPLHRLVQLQ